MSESTEKIEELSRQLASLREQRDQLNREARVWIEKRNALHEQIKNLRMGANNLKEKRDAINLKVKELKGLREQAKNERKEKHAQILKVREKVEALWKKKPSRNLGDIEREIESLEWKIQTTPLSVKEEKTLINQVRILESQRLIHKQIQELKDALIKLRTEEKALEARAKICHEKLAELAEQSQGFHEKIVETLNKAHNLKAEADVAHQKYLEINQNAYAIHQRCVEILQQKKSLKQEKQQKEKEQQAKRQEELREEAAKKALEKMKRGEKLTWEEFKILAEQGII